jgi:N-acetylmuramoyl-L-alanine amidase
VFVELAYHDNVEDATWIAQHLDSAARAIANGLTDYFGVPFATPVIPPRTGTVTLLSGRLNVRSYPGVNTPILASLGNGAQVTIVGEVGDWYAIERGDLRGYVNRKYVR